MVLRHRLGSDHEYGLVVPAFQESLGLSLIKQERWIWNHEEYLGMHHIGVYGVDNWNPNRLYAFTVYPRERELKRFFMATTAQWALVRDRYVSGRSKKAPRER